MKPSLTVVMPLSLKYWVPLGLFNDCRLDSCFFLLGWETFLILIEEPKLLLQLKHLHHSLHPCLVLKHGHLVFFFPSMSMQDTNPGSLVFLASPHLHSFNLGFFSPLVVLLHFWHLHCSMHSIPFRTQGHRELCPSWVLQEVSCLDLSLLPQVHPFTLLVSSFWKVVSLELSASTVKEVTNVFQLD